MSDFLALIRDSGATGCIVGRKDNRPFILCLCCGLRSSNARDIAARYCGRCHLFHDEPPSAPAESALPAADMRALLCDALALRGAADADLVRAAQVSHRAADVFGAELAHLRGGGWVIEVLRILQEEPRISTPDLIARADAAAGQRS